MQTAVGIEDGGRRIDVGCREVVWCGLGMSGVWNGMEWRSEGRDRILWSRFIFSDSFLWGGGRAVTLGH